jgi:SAM-dependent methyltransferase
LDLPPGVEHYRAFVGPPRDYDLIAAMTFNLLTTLGLRQHHTLLDIGCGSLRIARLLIPYLNVGHYTGIEPNQWLVQEGIDREVGRDQIRIKQPQFFYSDTARVLPFGMTYDFAVAQSIFSHCGPDLLEHWLADLAPRLKNTGALAATFLTAEEDCQQSGWIYPHCVWYRVGTMSSMARNVGLTLVLLDWKHPRQQWALYAKPGFDTSWFQGQSLTWNTMFEATRNRAAQLVRGA